MMTGPINELPLNGSLAINLFRVASVLDRHEILFWLDQGTLLGIIRDGALLPWEKDIDISLWQSDKDRVLALKPEFESLGLYVEHHENSDTIYVNGPSGFFVDLAFFHRNDTHAYRNNTLPKTQPWQKLFKQALQILPHSIHVRLRHFLRIASRPRQVQLLVPIEFFENLDQIAFEGHTFSVPSRTDNYLEFKYGDWRTPRQDWDFATQDGAVHKSNPDAAI